MTYSETLEKKLKEECSHYNALACYIEPKENETKNETKTRRRRIKSDLKKHKDLIVRSTVVLDKQKKQSKTYASSLTIPTSPIRQKPPDKSLNSPPHLPPKKRVNNNPSPKKNNNKPLCNVTNNKSQTTENYSNNIIDNERTAADVDSTPPPITSSTDDTPTMDDIMLPTDDDAPKTDDASTANDVPSDCAASSNALMTVGDDVLPSSDAPTAANNMLPSDDAPTAADNNMLPADDTPSAKDMMLVDIIAPIVSPTSSSSSSSSRSNDSSTHNDSPPAVDDESNKEIVHKLLNCDWNRFNPQLMLSFKNKIKTNGPAKDNTMQELVTEVNKMPRYDNDNCNLPIPFVQRDEGRLGRFGSVDEAHVFSDIEQTRIDKRSISLDMRLRGVALGGRLFTACDECFISLKMSNDDDRIANTLLPANILSSHDYEEVKGIVPEHSQAGFILDKDGNELLFNNSRINRTKGIVMRTSTVTGLTVYFDTKNNYKCGRNYGMIRVGDVIEKGSERWRKIKELATKIGENELAGLFQVMCAGVIEEKIIDMEEKKESEKELINQEEDDFIMNNILPSVEGFIKSCMKALLSTLDFKNDDPNELFDRILWLSWNPAAFEYNDVVDQEMLDWMELVKDKLRARVRNDNQNATEEEIESLYQVAVQKAKYFIYMIIISISQESTDDTTKKAFMRLFYQKYDALSFLEDIRDVGFSKFYYGLAEILRGASMCGSKALTIIQLAIKSYVDEDGGALTGQNLRACWNINNKKQRISDNCKSYDTGDKKDYALPGLDSHLYNGIGALIRAYIKIHLGEVASDSSVVQYTEIVAKLLPVEVGIYANEILAQIGQLNAKKRKKKTTTMSKRKENIRGEVNGLVKSENDLYKLTIEVWLEGRKIEEEQNTETGRTRSRSNK